MANMSGWLGWFFVVAGCEFPRPVDIGDDGTLVDARIATRFCMGTFVDICLEAAPTQPFETFDYTVIDTSNASTCATTNRGDYCVVAATSMNIAGNLRATGTKPLVLLATGSITTTAEIDVGSHIDRDLGAPETGAGADPALCEPGMAPDRTGGGGGAGGSFLGRGGAGGSGTSAPGGLAGPAAAPEAMLRGGCPGQGGQGVTNNTGRGGHGGGAVLLISGTRIDVSGVIKATGEGGGGAAPTAGGGGGGGGGMIAFDAPIVTCDEALLANGGGGGEGGGPLVGGSAGWDPQYPDAATGGYGGSPDGGNGGSGSPPSVAAPGGVGAAGTPNRGGGGGGGGGAGRIIKIAPGDLGTKLSPPVGP